MRRFLRWLAQCPLFRCTHETIRVVRWHADSVRPDMRDKLLYVDRHDVHCFAACVDCGTFLKGKQMEKLYDTKGST